MATLPAGTVAFSGFGDTPMKFHSPSGSDLGNPAAGNVECGSGCWGVVALSASGKLGVVGGSTPNFGTTGIGSFNSDLTFNAEYTGSHGGGIGAARDDADNFYALESSTGRLTQYDEDANEVASWLSLAALGFSFPQGNAVAVNGAGTIAYLAARDAGLLGPFDTVYQYPLGGSASSFKTKSGYKIQANAIVALSNGDVVVGWDEIAGSAYAIEHYNSSGTLLYSYTLTGAISPLCLTYGLTTSTIWVSAYSSAATASGVTVYEVELGTGTILHSFDPDDGLGFEYDGSFTVLTKATAVVATPTTPDVTLVNSVPCCGDTPTNPSGSMPGAVLPGTGWTPQCTGGGAIPTAADPTDSEDWDTTTATSADVWFQLHLAKYPASEGTTIYRWAKRPMADDASWKEGRLISFGTVTRSATTIDGDYNIGSVTVVVDDADAAIRTLLEQDTSTEYFLNREAGLYLLSPAGRLAGSTPRTLFRGWVSDVQTLKGRQVKISISDIVGSQFSGFNLDKEIPTILLADIADAGYLPDDLKDHVLPIYAGEPSDDGALDVNGNPAARGLVPAFAIGLVDVTDPDNTTPPTPTIATPPVITASSVTGTTGQVSRSYGATLITPYGESAMSNIVTLSGASIQNLSNYDEISGTFDGGVGDVNKVRIWYGPTPDHMVGWLDEANYNGSGIFGYFNGAAAWPSATRDEIDVLKTMDPPASGPNVNPNDWTVMAVCLGNKYDILNYYGSNLADGAEPARVELDPAVHGVELIGPDDSEWPYANTYIVRNGITFTGFLLRGNLLNAHLSGTITVAVNLCGPHDDDGLVINQAFRQLPWLVNEHGAKNNGTGYRTGDYWPLEAYANGDTLINTTAFEAAQDATKTYLGDAIGYVGMIALTEKTSLREIVRRFCSTFGCRLAHDHHGRIFPFFVDAPADVTAGRALREHIEIIDIGEPELAHDEIRNRETYSYHWDPEANAFRNEAITEENDVSIAAHVPGGVVGTPDRRGVKEGDPRQMYYTNDTATAEDVIVRELARRARRPRYLPVTVDLMGLEQEIGAQVRATHTEGLGSGGDVLMASQVLSHVTDADSLEVTLTLQDLRTLAAVEGGEILEPLIESLPGTGIVVSSDTGVPLYASV